MLIVIVAFFTAVAPPAQIAENVGYSVCWTSFPAICT